MRPSRTRASPPRSHLARSWWRAFTGSIRIRLRRTPVSRAPKRSVRRRSYSCVTVRPLREGDVDIQFLVERIEALVVNGRKVPMTSQVILEQAAILDLIKTLSVIKKSLEVLEERRAEPQGQEPLVR